MKTLKLVSSAFLLGLVGCYTISETQYPEEGIAPVPAGKSAAVVLSGFRTGKLYGYTPVAGHETMVPGDAECDKPMVQDINLDLGVRWDLQTSASGMVVVRALNELKRKGYTVASKAKPDYVIKAEFFGPVYPDNSALVSVGYAVFTLAMLERTEVTWTAKMQVVDAKSGKVLLEKEYEQNYNTLFGGPIPIGSTALHRMSTNTATSSWAITALADRLMADATSFIVGQLK